MIRRLSMHDPWLLWLSLLATVLGAFFIFDAGYARSMAGDRGMLPREFMVQLGLIPVALGLAAIAASLSPHSWRRLAKPFWLLSLVSLLLVMVPGIGIEMNGAHRWIKFWPAPLQPAEFAKLGVVLYLAACLAGRPAWPRRIKPARGMADLLDRIWLPKIVRFLPALWVLIAVVLIEKEPDLGTAAVMAATAGVMLFAGGISRKSIVWLGLLGVVGVVVMVAQEPYRLERITNHQHRWEPANVDALGYQTVQSELAMATGGWTGVGVGGGRAKHVLPASTTDFVTATIGEEFGLLGSLFVLTLLGSIAFRLLVLAHATSDPFARLVLIGTSAWIGCQSAVNVMMANGMLPAIGIPLPFFSSGGSSLIALWLAIGVCQSLLAPAALTEDEVARSGDRWRNRRARLSRA